MPQMTYDHFISEQALLPLEPTAVAWEYTVCYDTLWTHPLPVDEYRAEKIGNN